MAEYNMVATTNTIEEIRSKAKAFLNDNSLPSSRDEEWRFTNTRKYFSADIKPFQPADTNEAITLPAYYSLCSGTKLVFVNGVLDEHYSVIAEDSFEINPTANEFDLLGKGITADNYFTALNAAHFSSGFFLKINRPVKQPIHIFHVITTNDFVFPRVLVVAKANASVTINELYTASVTANVSTVTEVFLESNAQLNWNSVEEDCPQLNLVNSIEANCERDARFFHTSFAKNIRFVRNTTQARLNAENAYASLNGFYHTTGHSLVDNHVLIDHRMPNCESHQLFKGLLDDESTGVFNGKIMVHKDAQKTNAYQSSKAVLLSDNATVQSKPQLEIFADDVKCSHGAAIGQLNKNELFYFKARGVDEKTAKAILNLAYAIEVYERINDEALKNYLIEKLKTETNVDF